MQNDSNQDEVYENLKASRFKQQKLPAWRPVPTIMSTTITFVAFGVIFIVIGVVVLIYSGKVVEIETRYDNISDCQIDQDCYVKIEVTKKMEQPVMVYYQLNNFYQNHRRYVKSKSDNQLNGDYQTLNEIKNSDDCSPVETNADMGKKISVSGKELVQSDVAIPCGLIAKSLFNDTFSLYNSDKTQEIEIDQKDIAWEADKKLKYKNTEKPPEGKTWEDIQWIDMTDEHFMVWMRPAGLPDFRKLWGRVRKDLEPGTYYMKVNNRYDVKAFSGEKYLVLSTVNAFGGKNAFLGISYVVVGGICILLAIVFLVGYQIHQRKEK